MTEELFTLIGVILLGLNHGIIQAYLNTVGKASGASAEVINLAIPTALDIFLVFFLTWGIISSSKTSNTKAILVFILFVLAIAELYYVYAKPQETIVLGQVLLYTSTIFKLYILVSLHCDVTKTTSKDYISKGITKVQDYFKRKPKAEPQVQIQPRPQRSEPRPEPRVEVTEPLVKPEPDFLKASQIFNDAVKKTQLTPGEIEEVEQRFKSGMSEENPWNTMWNTFNNNVVEKIPVDTITKEQKDELRNKFKIAMGKTPKVGGRR
jgi:hypothetical protein